MKAWTLSRIKFNSIRSETDCIRNELILATVRVSPMLLTSFNIKIALNTI